MSDKNQKKGGRPRKNSEPLVAWDMVDKLLVQGEKVESDKGITTEFPTFRQLAKRFNISHSSVARYAKLHNCLQRRRQVAKKAQDISDDQLARLRAEELTVTRDDILRILEIFFLKFEQALSEGRVRCDNPTDFNTMLRLREFVLGNSDSRTETVCNITLDKIEEKYKQLQKEWDASTPEMRGEVVPIKGGSSKHKKTIH